MQNSSVTQLALTVLQQCCFSFSQVHRMAYDWAGRNWYFLDLDQSLIFLCHHDPQPDPGNGDGELLCQDLVSVVATKPRDLALDPAEGDTYCDSHQWLCDK